MKTAAMRCLAVLALTLCTVTAAAGQSAGNGSIAGTVTDPKGLVVPGAQVLVRKLDTGADRTLTTNEAGFYTAPYLQPGRYQLRVKKEGFAEVIRENLTLEVGQALAVDVDLPLKATQQTLTVTAAAGRIETQSADVSQTIAQDQVENLPLNGRRWDNLVLLTPGASEDGGFGLVSFRGISGLYNNNLVDGTDNNQAFFSETRGRNRVPYGYSLDAIREFHVATGVYSAEFGRAAGGIVNAVTRSGSNDYHGGAFYFLRDALWLARDPIANASGQPKPDERRQQYGGSVGGPIVHDRLFFFANYDQQKHNFPAIITPTDPHFFNTSSPNSQASNCVAAATLAAACRSVLNALEPLYNATVPRKGDNHIGLGKLDYQLDRNNLISGVANILRWDSPNGIFTSPVLSTSILANGTDKVETEFLTVAWNSVMKPTVVNEARFQYSRDFESQSPNHSGPSFRFDLIGGAQFGMRDFLPRGSFPEEKRFQWVDNLSWARGRHELKTGLDLSHVRDNIQNLFQGGGVYSYLGANALRNFVADLTTGSRSYSNFTQAIDPITGIGSGLFSTNDYNFYFQDNFKARRNFTVNLGLRYELQAMPGIVKANPLVPESARLNTDTNNLAPRFGFAWDLTGSQKQVIRGGYGIYYGRTQNSTVFIHLFQNGAFQRVFRLKPTDCGAPPVPNVLFPQPTTAPTFSPIFGTSGPTPTNLYPNLAAFLAACPSAGATSTVEVLDPGWVNPLVHEYDVTYERALPWKLDLSVSYLGARGNQLPIFYDANLPPPDTQKTYLIFDGSGSPLAPKQVTVPFFSGPPVAPRPRQGLGIVLMGKSVVNSWYNGLVLRLRRREAQGFAFDANFTYSKAIDDGQCGNTECTFANLSPVVNPFDLRGEYGRSALDIRKRFVMNFYWVTPFANWTANTTFKRIVGGWKASGIFRAQDGHPVTANLNGFPSCKTGDGGLSCGSVSAFASAAAGRVPFIERNSLFTSPALVNFDLRIAREFRLSERATFEFLWEAFNLFNRTSAVPGSKDAVQGQAFDYIAPSSHFISGNPSSPLCPNQSSLAGAPDFNGCLVRHAPPQVAPGSDFLTIQNTSNALFGARQMQFGAKFRF
jgi:hypothetical protein